MIRNICEGCCGFIAKDGYCAYCGTYYPSFDYSDDWEVEVDESPVAVVNKRGETAALDCVLVADGEKICPVNMEFEYDTDAIDVTTLSNEGLNVCIVGASDPYPSSKVELRTKYSPESERKLKALINKKSVSFAFEFLEGKSSFTFTGSVKYVKPVDLDMIIGLLIESEILFAYN